MDKKDKILILLAPIGLVVGGYLIFGDRIFPQDKTSKIEQENFTSIDAPITELRKKRTEIYRDKYEEENGKAYERNIQPDESFFGTEVRVEPGASDESEQLVTEPETQSTSSSSTDEPKVIIKYVERPKSESQTASTKAPVEEAQPARRRTGFVESKKETPFDNGSGVTTVESINIPAVVQDDIEVKSGSNIILRTTEEVIINGTRIPKNTLVSGVVNLGQQRLSIDVNTIAISTRSIPVKLKAYDLNGNEGMPLEGGVDKEIKRDVINDAISASRTIVRSPILSSSPSRAGQKKVNDPSVPVPKGYKIFLKSN
ncbi:MAG: conjugative transposon protein TraM [Cyclobacteriaceae bacterium]